MVLNSLGGIHVMDGNLSGARSAYEKLEPQLWDRETWGQAYKKSISLSCTVAWIMMGTGDETPGRELLATVLAYYETELPNYLDYPERYDATVCYLLAGDTDKALSLVELQVENGFYYSWWQRVRHPMLQQLRSEPRFVKVEQQLDEMQAQQRENVRRMEAEGKL